MRLSLSYGDAGLPVHLPDGVTTVIRPRFVEGLPDPESALGEALRSPIGAPPLRSLARKGDRVAISVCDITRAQPRAPMVGAIMDALEGVADAGDVVILVATGTHRKNAPEELEEMLGPEIASRLEIVNHDARDRAALEDLGTVKDGVPALLNRRWVEADLRITTGFVEPHFFAGFSGGPKMVAPGLAGIDTVLALHDARRIGSPLATWGVVEANPVQEGLRAVGRLAPAHFGIDVVLNTRQEITGVFAGDLLAEHEQACSAARRVAMQPVPAPFDVVVTTNSGYPLDQNLYQAVKGMSAAASVVKDGGTIICASECRDGLPDHGSYASILRSRGSPKELLEMIEAPGYHEPDQWQVQLQAKIQQRARVAVKSDYLTPAQLRDAHLDATHDVTSAVSEALRRAGPGATVCALPDGPQTIPYVAARRDGRP